MVRDGKVGNDSKRNEIAVITTAFEESVLDWLDCQGRESILASQKTFENLSRSYGGPSIVDSGLLPERHCYGHYAFRKIVSTSKNSNLAGSRRIQAHSVFKMSENRQVESI